MTETAVRNDVERLLAEVRDTKRDKVERVAALAEAWQLGEPLGRYAWFTLHLVLVRHAVLVGETERARVRALELVDTMLVKPDADVTNQDSKLRDALHRARRALRVPILARTIGLDIGDVLPKILATAQSDRTIDDGSRVSLLPHLFGAFRALSVEPNPIAEMMHAADSSPAAYQRSKHDAWFKPEATKKYVARPIHPFDRDPESWRRINAELPD